MVGESIISKKNSLGPKCRAFGGDSNAKSATNRLSYEFLNLRSIPGLIGKITLGVRMAGPNGECCKESVKVSCQAQKLPALALSMCTLARVWRMAHQMLLLKADEVARNGA